MNSNRKKPSIFQGLLSWWRDLLSAVKTGKAYCFAGALYSGVWGIIFTILVCGIFYITPWSVNLSQHATGEMYHIRVLLLLGSAFAFFLPSCIGWLLFTGFLLTCRFVVRTCEELKLFFMIAFRLQSM